MTFSPAFYRAAALCSMASAVTTGLLIVLPRLYGPAADFDQRMALVHHPAYVLRSWVYLGHPFLVLVAALAVAASRRQAAGASAALGFLGFVLWGFTEAAQQVLTLTTFDRWRVLYPASSGEDRARLVGHIALYDALWDAMYTLLLIGFLAGNVLYAAALSRSDRLGRVLAVFHGGAAVLTLSLLSRELGGPSLPGVVLLWMYPLLQPAARFLTGVWLWRMQDPVGAAAGSHGPLA